MQDSVGTRSGQPKNRPRDAVLEAALRPRTFLLREFPDIEGLHPPAARIGG